MSNKQQRRGEWLIAKGRNDPKDVQTVNFLWRDKSIYVMDNHRAAMWCWLQHVNPQSRHSLFHIDRHFDCLSSRVNQWLENCPPGLERLTIEQYLSCSYELQDGFGPGRSPLFSWDNYLSIYLARYQQSIGQLWMCTHNDGDKPERDFFPGSMWDIPENIDFWIDSNHGPWIFNLDLDYFFWRVTEGSPGRMVSDDYLTVSFKKIRQKIEDQTIAVTTIALTPQRGLTGGWAPAEELAEFILGTLGIDFELPHK